MKLVLVSSLFALTLAACLDTQVETAPVASPDDTTQLDDRTTADFGSETSVDNQSAWYCVEAWETDQVCVLVNAGFFQAAQKCHDQCARLGYADSFCARVRAIDACT